MLRNAFWVLLIAGASAAILAGFLQASVTTHPPPLAQLRASPAPLPRSLVAAGVADQSIEDPFAQDDVVVDRPRPPQPQWQRPRLVAFVGVCGGSVAAVSPFLRLGFPLAFVLDPQAAGASRVAALVRDSGQALFVQLAAPPNAAALARLRRLLGTFDGVAARDGAGMAAALRGTGAAFFDERGDADPAAFVAAGVALIRRDATVDDRSGQGYVAFMLGRAAALSRRVGPVVVLLRPLPTSMRALRAYAGSHDVQMIAFR